jgi:prepilin-type N-terminal cleavage/methylation domain-containing protein
MSQLTNSKVNHVSGFTMIELLVTLVLLGLIASVAAPGIDAWLRSRQASAVRLALSSEMALLPLKAKNLGEHLLINSVGQLDQPDLPLRFIAPISVLSNGYCQGGQVELMQNSQAIVFDVLPPLCEVRRLEAK